MRIIQNVRYITNIKNNIHNVENGPIKYNKKGENIFHIWKYEASMCKTYLSFDNRFNISEQRKMLYNNRISKYMNLKRNNTYKDIKYLFLYIEFDKKAVKHFFEDSLPQKSIALQILTKLNYLLILNRILNNIIPNDRTINRCINYIFNNDCNANNYNENFDDNFIYSCIIEHHASTNKEKIRANVGVHINEHININTNMCTNTKRYNFNDVNNIKQNTYPIFNYEEKNNILINNYRNNGIYKNVVNNTYDISNIHNPSNSYNINNESSSFFEKNILYHMINKYDIVIYSNINNKNIKHIYIKDLYRHIYDQINYVYMFDNKLYDKNVILKLYTFYEYFNDELEEKKKEFLFFLDRISERLLNNMNLIDLVFIFHIHIKRKYYNFLFLYILINKLYFYINNIVNIPCNKKKLKDINREKLQQDYKIINKLKYDNISIDRHKNNIRYNVKWLTLFYHYLIEYFVYLNNSSHILINHKDKILFIKHLLYNNFAQMFLKYLGDNYVYFTPINILSIYSSFRNLNIINDETLKCVLFKYINYSNILLLKYKGDNYDYKDKHEGIDMDINIDKCIDKHIYNKYHKNEGKNISIYNNNDVQIFYSSFLNIFSKFFVYFKFTNEEYKYILKSLLILFDNYLILILQLYIKNESNLLSDLGIHDKKGNENLIKYAKEDNIDKLFYINEEAKQNPHHNNNNKNNYTFCDDLKYIKFINLLKIIMNSNYTNFICSYNYDIKNINNDMNIFCFNYDNIYNVENIEHNIKYIVNSLNSLYKITEHFINSYKIDELSKLFNKTYLYNFITKFIYNKYINYNNIPYYKKLYSFIHLSLHNYDEIYHNFYFSINRLFISNYILNLYLTNLVSVYLNKLIRNIKEEETYHLEKKEKQILQKEQHMNFIYLVDTKKNEKTQNEKIQNEKTQNEKTQNEKTQNEKTQNEKTQNISFLKKEKENHIYDTFFFSQLVTNSLGAIQHMKILRYDIFVQISSILKTNIFPLSLVHIGNIIHSYASFKIQDLELIKYLLYKLIKTNNLINIINDQSLGNISISLLKLNYYNEQFTRIILNNYNKIISLQALINITFYLSYYNNELLEYFLKNHLNYFIEKICKSNMLHDINIKAKTQLKLISYQILYIHEYTSKGNIQLKEFSCLFNYLDHENILHTTSYDSYIYTLKKVCNNLLIFYYKKEKKTQNNHLLRNNYILLPYQKYIKIIQSNLLYYTYLKYHEKENKNKTNTFSSTYNMNINKNIKYDNINQDQNNGINVFDIFNYKIMNSKINMDINAYKPKNVKREEIDMSYKEDDDKKNDIKKYNINNNNNNNNNNNQYVKQVNIINHSSYLHLLFISAFPFEEKQIYTHSELYNQVYDTIVSLNLKRKIIKELLHYPYYVDIVIL
ncbi:conserved Plasmodium membrane protein, unknown function [Plasmodium reichenowi]|uniref:Uncharacterized protein n=1 Tax=Plasmodium reichenowi TaxID=5854 RepID=A0A060RWJ6_PLARE|nr:conserved Plasmodium membrane protein, unknown function [Plasmodium reichenowi]